MRRILEDYDGTCGTYTVLKGAEDDTKRRGKRGMVRERNFILREKIRNLDLE